MGKNTRKSHFVPQAHIRNFGYKNNNTYKIIVFDKKKIVLIEQVLMI